MTNSLESGVALIIAGRFSQGSFMLPTKALRHSAWEHYWLIFAITAYHRSQTFDFG